MGVWNEPGMYLESNSVSVGGCYLTSSTAWSMNTYYLCINHAIISYRHQLRGKPNVCNDQCAGHSSWSEDATEEAYDRGARDPWELGSRCSTASLGHQSEDRWEGQFERLHKPSGQQGPLKCCRGHLLTPALPVLWVYCHCQQHYRSQVTVLKGEGPSLCPCLAPLCTRHSFTPHGLIPEIKSCDIYASK